MNEYTRANDFDRLVGKIQTEYAIKYGVGNSLLDIGCGVGEYTPLFLSRFKRVVGLDPSKEYLKEAKQNTQGISYLLGYGETFTTNERFDTISMNNILEHVDDPIALLQNCKNTLNMAEELLFKCLIKTQLLEDLVF